MYKSVWSVLATKQITQQARGSNSLLVVTVARETISLYSVWQQPLFFFFLANVIEAKFVKKHEKQVYNEMSHELRGSYENAEEEKFWISTDVMFYNW